MKIPHYFNNILYRQAASIAARTVLVRFYGVIATFFAHLLLWRFGAKVGRDLRVSGRMRCFNKGRIIIGRYIRINSGPDNNYVGGDRRTNLWVSPGAQLEIEDGVALSNTTIVARASVKICQDTFIGGGCDIYDNDFHEVHPDDREARVGNIGIAPVVIGPRAFIGGHTIILKGVHIGEGAVIGAGSLVSKDVPPFQVWAGRPARFVKQLPQAQTENL